MSAEGAAGAATRSGELLAPEPETSVNVSNLTVTFDGFKAVDDVSLLMLKGQVHFLEAAALDSRLSNSGNCLRMRDWTPNHGTTQDWSVGST